MSETFRFEQLVNLLVRTLERQGAMVLVHGNVPPRPAHLSISTAAGNTDCMVYLWSIIAGGGPGGERPKNERRIQITGMSKTGFPLQPGTRTLIGGFNGETGVWGFWDARRHSRFSHNSPSFQVNLHTLEEAGNGGIATQRRPIRGTGNRGVVGHEVVAAIVPDSLLYLSSG